MMTVRERVLAIRLLERKEKDPAYLRRLGVHVTMKKVESTDTERSKKRIV